MVDAQINRVFGENLRQLRKTAGQTRQIFAAECDTSAYTIQSYELGRKGPTYKRFLQICNAKKVSPNQLLAGLLPNQSEVQTISALNELYSSINATLQHKITGLLDIFINCMLKTEPTLVNASFGTRVQVLRQNMGMSTEDLAAECMIARPTLQGYESSQFDPSLSTMLRLCEVLHVSPEYLMVSELEYAVCSDMRLLNLLPHELTTLNTALRYMISTS